VFGVLPLLRKKGVLLLLMRMVTWRWMKIRSSSRLWGVGVAGQPLCGVLLLGRRQPRGMQGLLLAMVAGQPVTGELLDWELIFDCCSC
jgi:hypothetical protein